MCTGVKHLSDRTLMIVGATILSVMKSTKYNQELWIFGESHQIFEAKNCNTPDITLTEYLTALLLKHFYDVFIEFEYKQKDKQNYSFVPNPRSQIFIIHNLLSQCYTDTCPFKVRLHHIDYRTRPMNRFIFDYLYLLNEILDHTNKSPDRDDFINKLKILSLQIRKTILDPNRIETFFGVKHPNKIEVEIDRIDAKFDDTKDKLKDMYVSTKKKILTITTEAQQLVLDIDKFIEYLKEEFSILGELNRIKLSESWNRFQHKLLYYTVDLLDIYTLARMFHRFNVGDINNDQPSVVNYGLFYGGEKHSRNIIEHLKRFGYTEVFHDINDQGCIRVPAV